MRTTKPYLIAEMGVNFYDTARVMNYLPYGGHGPVGILYYSCGHGPPAAAAAAASS